MFYKFGRILMFLSLSRAYWGLMTLLADLLELNRNLRLEKLNTASTTQRTLRKT